MRPLPLKGGGLGGLGTAGVWVTGKRASGERREVAAEGGSTRPMIVVHCPPDGNRDCVSAEFTYPHITSKKRI